MQFVKSPVKSAPYRLILGLSSLAILASLSGYFLFVKELSFSKQSTAEESVQPLTKSEIVALGRIEPEGEVIKIAPASTLTRSKVAEVRIKEGQSVITGQIVAVLDTLDIKKAAVAVAQQQLKVAQANLAVIKAGAKQGAINAQQATIQRLQAELQGSISTSSANIARLQAQLTGEQQSQKATIERLKAELTNASTELQRYEYLAQEGVISQSDLDQRRLSLATAQESVNEAQANLTKTVSTLEQQIVEAQAQAQENQLTLEAQIKEAQATLNSIAEVRSVDVQRAEAEVAQMTANLQQAQTDLEMVYIRAPMNGQILKIMTHAGEETGANGILQMGKIEQMYAVAEVYETDIGLVKVGQSATISSPALSSEVSGTVTEIGRLIFKNDLLGDDPAADSDARVVEVKIRLQKSQEISQFTNLQVDVRIQVN